jgi:hypothetical protein
VLVSGVDGFACIAIDDDVLRPNAVGGAKSVCLSIKDTVRDVPNVDRDYRLVVRPNDSSVTIRSLSAFV